MIYIISWLSILYVITYYIFGKKIYSFFDKVIISIALFVVITLLIVPFLDGPSYLFAFAILLAIFSLLFVEADKKSIKPLPKSKYSDEEFNSLVMKIDNMKGKEFEELIARLFKTKGFKYIELTPDVNDYGADVIAYKKGKKLAIQVKRSKSNIGVKAIQEVASAKTYYSCNFGVVITNSFFYTQC